MIEEPQVLIPKRNEYGKKMRKAYEAHEHKESRHNMTDLVPRDDGIANTITTVQKDNLLIEPRIRQKGRGFNKGGLHEISPTITSNSWEENNLLFEPVEDVGYDINDEDCSVIDLKHIPVRIRKLTERECFRLMDMTEENIDKIQAAGISKTQQYRMAGNSIVVSCLYYIFRNLFTEQERTTLF